MQNEIIERQNEDKSINYLAAQRQLYNEVKKLDNVGILFSVILPLFFATLQLIIKENTYLNVASYVLSILSMFIGLILNSYVSHKKGCAAEIQQYFDIYVYQMPWDNKLFGKKRNVNHIVAEKSQLLLKKAGEREKLLDWYTSIVGTVDLLKGILMCQKENYCWDVGLRKRFRLTSSIIIGIMVVIIFSIGVFKNETVVMLLCRFAFVIPMFQWLFETIKNLNEDIENLKEIDELVNSPEEKNMDDLQEIQSKIYTHRKSCFAIPNRYYERYKNNDEDNAHRTALMDR